MLRKACHRIMGCETLYIQQQKTAVTRARRWGWKMGVIQSLVQALGHGFLR